jgi:multicomponent Na+:H+ antiporter subunit D
MIGVPPMAGFVSKWYLAVGALEACQPWMIGVLAASSLLNAGYFLPIVYRAWFRLPSSDATEDEAADGLEIKWSLLLPPLITALLALMAGLFAASGFSPLAWAEVITSREFGP